MKAVRNLFLILTIAFLAACGTAEAPKETKKTTVGMILVGPINDGGWSQAHYDAMKRVEADAGIKFLYVDKVNPADRPNVKVEQVAQELIDQGASMVIANSDDFKDGIREAAKANPNVNFIHASGDDVMSGKAPANLGNLMGQMEYGKMIAGCAAGLQTKTGKIAYLGPLINDETRRLVNAAYLGANYCWTALRGEDPTKLQFSVTWVGFWFNIPGVTLDPTKIMGDFLTQGNDVVLSGIDTPDAIIEAAKARAAGKEVWALPYDHETACERGPDACLGVAYFNWYPEYMKMVKQLEAGTWKPTFGLFGPNWEDMNNPNTGGIGFKVGNAFAHQDKLNTFISFLAEGNNLFTGPLNYQDGSVFLAQGERASVEKIWYQTSLLDGISGQAE
jgi:simple sugar transport system substrate-binding protein